MASGLPAQTIPSMSIFRGRLARDHDLVGCFDEESCRYFLREVGSKVVPFYPFTFGMEEVYSLIIEEYGLAGIPDATSVLQDLLENERTAGGLGDDGDIWRSWRHSWRHRNVRPLQHPGCSLTMPRTTPSILSFPKLAALF